MWSSNIIKEPFQYLTITVPSLNGIAENGITKSAGYAPFYKCSLHHIKSLVGAHDFSARITHFLSNLKYTPKEKIIMISIMG